MYLGILLVLPQPEAHALTIVNRVGSDLYSPKERPPNRTHTISQAASPSRPHLCAAKGAPAAARGSKSESPDPPQYPVL
jgi:hypothetical protein